MGWDCLDSEDEGKSRDMEFGQRRDHLVLFDSILANFCIMVGWFGDHYTIEDPELGQDHECGWDGYKPVLWHDGEKRRRKSERARPTMHALLACVDTD